MRIRLFSLLLLGAIGSWSVATASAAEDAFHEFLLGTCLATESAWIGKDQKSIEANCACKAKSEAAMASPGFKEAVLKKEPYDQFPFGDPANYQKQILTDCPKLRPLMIDAVCKDPAAPPDACAAMKDMVSKLK